MATDATGGPGRSPQARALAESALARLAGHLGDRLQEVVVVGGLVPAGLAAGATQEHLGTTDVDLVLPVAVSYDREEADFGWLENALCEAGFHEETYGSGGGGWRWWCDEDGRPVKVEILCDVGTDPRGVPIPLPGCVRVSAINLVGPRAALYDPVPRAVHGRSGELVVVPHAGLGGYLLAKAAAAASRRLPRDFYDLAYVLLNNDAGGPRQAAEAVLRPPVGDLVDQYRLDLVGALRPFLRAPREAARHFALDALRMTSAEDAMTFERLVEDASAAAQEFADGLGLQF